VTAKLGNFRAALSTTTAAVDEAAPEFVVVEVGDFVDEEVAVDETPSGRLYDG
jgi:hypothetical protein